jgi:hypothetical protein
MLIVQGLDHRARLHGRADVAAIGEGGQGDVRRRPSEHRQRQQPFEAVDRAVREHHARERDQHAGRHQRSRKAQQQGVRDDVDMRPVGPRQLLGKTALQPQRRQLGRELDRDGRDCEAAERFGAIDAPGDEQER